MQRHLGGYGFAVLGLLALYADMIWPALGCAVASTLTWKGHRPR